MPENCTYVRERVCIVHMVRFGIPVPFCTSRSRFLLCLLLLFYIFYVLSTECNYYNIIRFAVLVLCSLASVDCTCVKLAGSSESKNHIVLLTLSIPANTTHSTRGQDEKPFQTFPSSDTLECQPKHGPPYSYNQQIVACLAFSRCSIQSKQLRVKDLVREPNLELATFTTVNQ